MKLVLSLNFMSLLILCFEVSPEEIELYEAVLSPASAISQCPGGYGLAKVHRLIMFGKALNWTKEKRSARVAFQQKLQGHNTWYNVCEKSLLACTANENHECDCIKSDEANYNIHLNISVKVSMSRARYRLIWESLHEGKLVSEEKQIPSIYNSVEEVITYKSSRIILPRTGKCEINIPLKKPFSYCVHHLTPPYSIRLISLDTRQDKVAAAESVNTNCTHSNEGFLESGAILAFTETKGCRRRHTRLCSLKGHQDSLNLTVAKHQGRDGPVTGTGYSQEVLCEDNDTVHHHQVGDSPHKINGGLFKIFRVLSVVTLFLLLVVVVGLSVKGKGRNSYDMLEARKGAGKASVSEEKKQDFQQELQRQQSQSTTTSDRSAGTSVDLPAYLN